jgi:hypothetical protein
MMLGILTLITALSISAVAIYYSVAGLVAIFAAAAIPIMIMGGTLEVAKLVTAVWLHRYWSQATWWLRTYLTTAVIVLMLITSMGIFGFLSKAHIEQTSASQESVAQVDRLTTEIARQNAIVARAEEQITKLETSVVGGDASIQNQIDKEQERIDSAYSRVQPAIEEQQRIIDSQGELYRNELAKIDSDIETLQGYIDNGEVKKAQQMIGASADGIFGKNTAEKIGDWKAEQEAKRTDLLTKIEQASNNAQAQAAADEIKRLRQTVESQIADSNNLINRLRQQLAQQDKVADIDADIDEQNARIREANKQIDILTEEKYTLEAEYRKLEAEVGPVKYIAEFIYGEQANTNLLEEAVRWVIIVIIFVFDPLAVLLLIASQYTFEFARRKDDDGGWLRQYEQIRAQRIVDNPGYNTDDPAPMEEKEQVDGGVDIQQSTTDSTRAGDSGRDTANGVALAREGTVENVTESITTTDDTVGDVLSKDDTTNTDVPVESVEPTEVQTDEPTKEQLAAAYNDIEKKESVIELQEESNQERERREAYEAKEQDESFVLGKHRWKEENPDKTLKHYKNLYIKGVIDQLPWEEPVQDDNYNAGEGYRQNEEQNENTLFNRLQNR